MKVAIQGHSIRGREVIQILENLGGVNRCPLKGNVITNYYYIDYNCKNAIHCHDDGYVNKYCKKYTLEEFEKEFPFKIGDLCTYSSDILDEDIVVKILGMAIKDNCVMYEVGHKDNTNGYSYIYRKRDTLKHYKEMNTRNVTLTLEKAKEWYKKGGELKEIALQAFTEKELTKVELPKTWEEFCDNYPVQAGECWIGSCDGIYERSCDRERIYKNWIPSKKSAEAHLAMIQLEQLRDCWRQGWVPATHASIYAIKFSVHGLCVYNFNSREFLSFPTKEMAEEFLKCFRNLIEKAGDLI